MGVANIMKKIIVRGPALSQSGYGEQTRFALRSLRKFPDRFDVYLMNTIWGKTGWIWENNEERGWFEHCMQKFAIAQQQQNVQFDISLQVCIPNEWQKLAPKNIGYTAGIETTKISPEWMKGCFNVDKILLTSHHAKYGFEKTEYPATENATGRQIIAKVDVPMDVTPYPVRLYDAKKIDLELKYDFNFLCVAQWNVRKNIENTIKWFLEEFHNKEVGLVLKLSSVNNSLLDRTATTQRLKDLLATIPQYNSPDRKCAIHFLHGDLSPEEMTYLYQHEKIKALISLTHGEGFGLPLFEAVYNGLPLIAPAWGGQSDFISMPQRDKEKNKIKNTCMIQKVAYDIAAIQPEAVWPTVLNADSSWCFPQALSAKKAMEEVYKNYGGAKSKANKLKEYVLKEFEANKMMTHFAECVDEYYPVINIEDLLNDMIEEKNPMKQVVEYA